MSIIAEVEFNKNSFVERWSRIKEDFWGDLKIHTNLAVKKLLESMMEIEVQDLIGARRWQHHPERSTYRNGHYTRTLLTSMGWITSLKVPRVRGGAPASNLLPRYAQRAPDVDKMVMEMFLAGTSTRRVQEVLTPLAGPRALSATTVSRITRVLDAHVRRFHRRPLPDTYEYLILDGIYLNAKSPLKKRRRCVLVVYGIMANGHRELVDFELAPSGESQAAWERFLNLLYHRGLEGRNLKLAVLDGNRGSWNALNLVYPHVPRQRCWAHKLRNVANYLPRKLQDACIGEARAIYRADTKVEALSLFRTWARGWRIAAPKAVECLEADMEHMLHFLDCPRQLQVKLRTTNVIERVFREVRRRTRPMSCFQNPQSVERVIYAIFCRMNSIWKTRPL
ncbi:MAG: IS256 family transposase [Elusimicrobia bacterium]|nr:IS256 family transposase [Elusimicrobiota bacterium]